MLQVRVKNFYSRLKWLSELVGSQFLALFFLVSGKLGYDPSVYGRFGICRFRFRYGDLRAIKEVMVDQEYSFVKDYLSKSDKIDPIILDVGAHIGTFPIWIFSFLPKAIIFSVEASPKNYNYLEHNKKCNDQLCWEVVNAAAWDRKEDVPILETKNTMSYKCVLGGERFVRGITLQELLMKFRGKEIDLLKIDIEGSEERFICSDLDQLKNVRALVLELHPDFCDSSRITQSLLVLYKYIHYIKQRDSDKPLLFCTN